MRTFRIRFAWKSQGHEVFTAAYMGWSGIENGELLRKAADAGFDALITNDRGLEHEQKVDALPLAVIVLLSKANTSKPSGHLCPSCWKCWAGSGRASS